MTKDNAPIATRTVTPIDAFRNTVSKMGSEFKAALPPQIPVERFVRTTITAAQMNPALLEADRRTLLAACMRAAQDGLLPDGREAALVIFKKSGGAPTVQYMPMIAGLFKKVRNSGEIASIGAHIAYRNDRFEFELGDNERIVHTPKIEGDRGDPIYAYAIARTKDGAIYREVMSVADIEKVRAVSRAKSDDSPWFTWWDEMARKTVFRRLAKRLPSSADLEQALAHDNEVIGFAPSALDPDPPAAIEHGATRTKKLIGSQAKGGEVKPDDANAGDASASAPGALDPDDLGGQA
jgi:recombination protein RecT